VKKCSQIAMKYLYPSNLLYCIRFQIDEPSKVLRAHARRNVS
jgi:hypothetical protein